MNGAVACRLLQIHPAHPLEFFLHLQPLGLRREPSFGDDVGQAVLNQLAQLSPPKGANKSVALPPTATPIRKPFTNRKNPPMSASPSSSGQSAGNVTDEASAGPGLILDPNGTAVSFHDLPGNRQTQAAPSDARTRDLSTW